MNRKGQGYSLVVGYSALAVIQEKVFSGAASHAHTYYMSGREPPGGAPQRGAGSRGREGGGGGGGRVG